MEAKRTLFPIIKKLLSNLPSQRSLCIVLKASLIIVPTIFLVRFLGALQPLELWAFDKLISLRLNDPIDDRILIIEITPDDFKAWADEPRTHAATLPDKVIAQLLDKLEGEYHPRAIGLDIYRSFQSKDKNLAQHLRNQNHLVVVCKKPEIRDDDTGIVTIDHTAIDPPNEIAQKPDRQGFSDFIKDDDGVLRRYLFHLQLDDPGSSTCTTDHAFSFQLALHYLGHQPKLTPEGYSVNGILFNPINDFTGGYQGINAGGHQILLNYRFRNGYAGNIARRVELGEVLGNKISDINQLQGRIVLIGITDPASGDTWTIPGNEEIPGVVIQAQMVSQVLRAVEDKEPLLRALPQWQEYLWFLGWSVTSGIGFFVVLNIRNDHRNFSLMVTTSVLWGVLCDYRNFSLMVTTSVVWGVLLLLYGWMYFVCNIWLPIIPSLIVSGCATLSGYIGSGRKVVKLNFPGGIDWKKFTYVFQSLNQHDYGGKLVIQTYKADRDGSQIVELALPPETDAKKINHHFMQAYKEAVLAEYPESSGISDLLTPNQNMYEKQSGREILVSAEGSTVNVYYSKEKMNVANDSPKPTTTHVFSGNFGGGIAVDGGMQIGGTLINAPAKTDLTEAAKEIQALLEQLSKTYPTTTSSDQEIFAEIAVKEIEKNPQLKQQIVDALRAGTFEGLKQMVNHPVVHVVLAAVEGWQTSR